MLSSPSKTISPSVHHHHQQHKIQSLSNNLPQQLSNNVSNKILTQHNATNITNSTTSNTTNTLTNSHPLSINTMMTSYSASYSNLKSSTTTTSSNSNQYITRQSSNLTTTTTTTLPLHINSKNTTVNHIPNNSNFSQNNPKTLNSTDYNTQSTNSPALANKAMASKHGNIQSATSNTVSNNNTVSTTAILENSNYSLNSSAQFNNRTCRSTSNGSEVPLYLTPINTMRTNGSTEYNSSRLRGMAISSSSLATLEKSPKLPPLSLHRLEKSTSAPSLENLNLEPATPRVVNLDKYFKFAQLIMDEEACEVFLEFLRKKRNEENLEFILQVSALKKIPSLTHGAAIEILQRIRSDFLTNGSMYELNVNKQVKSLSIDRIDRCLQQPSSSHSSLNFASSPVFSLPSSSPSTPVSTLTYSTTIPSVDNSYDSISLISSSFSSVSLLHSSPRDSSECSSSTFTEIPHQPITTSTILKEIELEVRLQLQNESFKEFKASDEFEHFLLTKVIEQSQNNNPVGDQSPQNSPHQTDSVNSSRSDKSNPSVGSPQSGGFFSKIFKKKSTNATTTTSVQQEPKSDESITDDEMSVSSGETEYVYNPQNPNDITFVENLQIRKWNNQQVINFFTFKLDLPEYSDALKKNDIKGVDLSLMKREDTPDLAADKIDTSDLQKKVEALYKKIKMVKLGHKKKLQREVNEAIIAYQKKQQKSNKISSLERPRKVSDSLLPKSQISTAMEADLTTIIVKLWILPMDQKRVFTVKRCIKLDRLKTIILKEIGDIIEKKYTSENPAQFMNGRVIKSSKGESLTSSEKLYQYLCSESTNSQFVTLKIEI